MNFLFFFLFSNTCFFLLLSSHLSFILFCRSPMMYFHTLTLLDLSVARSFFFLPFSSLLACAFFLLPVILPLFNTLHLRRSSCFSELQHSRTSRAPLRAEFSSVCFQRLQFVSNSLLLSCIQFNPDSATTFYRGNWSIWAVVLVPNLAAAEDTNKGRRSWWMGH